MSHQCRMVERHTIQLQAGGSVHRESDPHLTLCEISLGGAGRAFNDDQAQTAELQLSLKKSEIADKGQKLALDAWQQPATFLRFATVRR